MVKQSRSSYADTIAALSKAIADAGNTIFATIDQAAAAKSTGLSLRPTTLMIFGNPKGGTPLMEAFPLIALDLPLKLLIWEDGAVVNVAYTPASEIASRYGVPANDPRIAAMDRALTALSDSVA
jgi:uncharacterized protein (DUF302 family)